MANVLIDKGNTLANVLTEGGNSWQMFWLREAVLGRLEYREGFFLANRLTWEAILGKVYGGKRQFLANFFYRAETLGQKFLKEGIF